MAQRRRVAAVHAPGRLSAANRDLTGCRKRCPMALDQRVRCVGLESRSCSGVTGRKSRQGPHPLTLLHQRLFCVQNSATRSRTTAAAGYLWVVTGLRTTYL
jgi:hypothetical protein